MSRTIRFMDKEIQRPIEAVFNGPKITEMSYNSYMNLSVEEKNDGTIRLIYDPMSYDTLIEKPSDKPENVKYVCESCGQIYYASVDYTGFIPSCKNCGDVMKKG